jgi:hypothetical protein
MSLADRLSAATPTSKGKVCRISWVRSELSEADAAALNAAMAVPVGHPERLSSVAIADALAEEGFKVHSKTVENHRRGVCSCDLGPTPET